MTCRTGWVSGGQAEDHPGDRPEDEHLRHRRSSRGPMNATKNDTILGLPSPTSSPWGDDRRLVEFIRKSAQTRAQHQCDLRLKLGLLTNKGRSLSGAGIFVCL